MSDQQPGSAAEMAKREAQEWLKAHAPRDFPDLSERERLTLLAHIIRSALTPDGSHRALIDYIADLGAPIHELLAPAEPLTTAHYSRATLEHLMAVLSWNQRPPLGRVVRGDPNA